MKSIKNLLSVFILAAANLMTLSLIWAILETATKIMYNFSILTMGGKTFNYRALNNNGVTYSIVGVNPTRVHTIILHRDGSFDLR